MSLPKVKQLRELSDQVISLAHKVNYAFEIKSEDEADAMIKDVCETFTKLLEQYEMKDF